MKMNSRRPSNTRTILLRLLYIVVFLGIFSFAIFSFPAFNTLRVSILNTIDPLLDLQAGIPEGVSNIGGVFQTRQQLLNENRELSQKVSQFEALQVSYERLSSENTRLQELIGGIARSDERIVAAILLRPSRTPYDTLLVAAGREDGVAIGDLIYASFDVVVGRVVEVFSDSARVVMFSAGGEEIDVLVGNDAISATAIGRGGGNFRISLPREVVVSEGDIIALPAISGKILGVVSFVSDDPQDAFREILFKTPVNIQQLTHVEIAI